MWKFEEQYFKYGGNMDRLKKKNLIGYRNMSYIERKPNAFRYMPLVDHEHFKTQVNINFSSVRAAVNLYGRGLIHLLII